MMQIGQKILQKLDRLARVLPILRWLPSYEAGWFRADVIAGLTLWGILVPEGIAYAGLPGAPVQTGLYTLLASLVAYAILGTTRQAVSAPTSGSSIMMATVVAPFLVTEPGELAELLVLLVLVVGIIFLLCGLVRLGFMIAFISHSVMTGFVFGLAIYIAVSQAPKLFGLSRAHGETLYQLLASHRAAGGGQLGNLRHRGRGPGPIVHHRGARAPGPRAADDHGRRNPGGFRLATRRPTWRSGRRRRPPRIACFEPAEGEFG